MVWHWLSVLLVCFKTRVTSTVSERLVLSMGWGEGVTGSLYPHFWFGELCQTNTRSVSGSVPNGGSSSYTSYSDGSYSYKNPIYSSVWFIHFTDRVLLCDSHPGYHPSVLYTIVGESSEDQVCSGSNHGYCKHQEDSHCIWIPKMVMA